MVIPRVFCRWAWQQKPRMRQLARVPRDESRLLLLAAFERPLLGSLVAR